MPAGSIILAVARCCSPPAKEKDKTDIYQLAEEGGYKVIKTQAEAEALTAADGKAIVVAETLADSDAMSYANDRDQGEWALADYVKKGIEVLDNDTGFFMMVEGGKIDWACHANDAGSTLPTQWLWLTQWMRR